MVFHSLVHNVANPVGDRAAPRDGRPMDELSRDAWLHHKQALYKGCTHEAIHTYHCDTGA